MQDKLKEAKRTLKKRDLEAWIETKKAVAIDATTNGPLLQAYIEKFKVHGKDEVRRKHVQKYQLRNRRQVALHACARNESWYDAVIWREFLRGTRGERLVRLQSQMGLGEAEILNQSVCCPLFHCLASLCPPFPPSAVEQEHRIHSSRVANQQGGY